MRTIYLLIPLFFAIFLIPSCAGASDLSGITKEINKEYVISPDAKVTLKNSFGSIHCTTWDKDEISINIVITVDTESQEKADKIFQPNFTTRSGGAGLGLAIVKRILDLHNSDIQVSSQLEQGTCFSFSLPQQKA